MRGLGFATSAVPVPLTPRRSGGARMGRRMAFRAFGPGQLRGLSVPDVRARPGCTRHPRTSHPARCTSTRRVWVGGPVSVRSCTTGVTACRACAAAPRVRQTSSLAAASRVRWPRARSCGVQYSSRTGQSRVANTGLLPPPWGDPRVVGCHGPAATTPAFRHWRSRLQTRRSLLRRATRRRRSSGSMGAPTRSLATATTYPCEMRGAWPTLTTGVALRCARKPADGSGKWASPRGLRTLGHAGGTTRSRTVGIPRGRSRPSAGGRSTRRTGGGLSRPARRSCASAWSQAVTPCRSASSLCTASTPALPPLARQARQARHRRSGRHRRASSAGQRRVRLRLAAW